MKKTLHSLITIKRNSCFYKIIFITLLVILLTNGRVNSQDELGVINQYYNRGYWLHFSDAPNSLYHHLEGQAYDLLEKRVSEIVELHSLSDWQQRQKWIKETLVDIVGPFPEKTPLNAKILRKIDKDNYRIEHIVFESQPGFYVTSSLFIPAGLKKNVKAPVVIYCSGHWDEGYHNPGAQPWILNLVKKGFIVFAFDPVGQGERIQYYDPKTGKSTIGGATSEHSYPGAQSFITGSSQARYMIWDGIRAVDYIISRKDVDPSRIGITGSSGGGTQSAYIAAMDDRIYAAAPENYITNSTRLLQAIGPQDAEQNLFNAIVQGIDHADLLSVRAPKPALIITTTRDIFSIQGARETEKEVSIIYRTYGKEDNFSRVEDDALHESTKKNREALYAFFQKHLNNPGNSSDEETQPLSVEEMQVTKTGQVSTSLGGETVFSLNLRKAEKLINELQTSRGDLTKHLPEVLNSAKRLSGYQEPEVFNEPVFTGRFQREGYVIEKYFIKGEGDYVIPFLLMIPASPNYKALIYLHPSGKAAEASTGEEIEWFVRNGFTVLAPDMIGIGEIGPSRSNVFQKEWYLSILIGRSIVGIRVGDVVRLSRLLGKNKDISEVYGLARKEMSPVLLHAAAFDPAITRIALIEPYSSYCSIVMNRFYNTAFIHSTVPGALKAYDLPDLAASLAPRKLLMAGIMDGNGKNEDDENISKDIAIIKTSYRFRNADGQLNIVSLKPNEKPYDFFMEWIK